MIKTMTFAMDKTGMRLMAIYVAQLVKEEVTFEITNDNAAANVKLTGGY